MNISVCVCVKLVESLFKVGFLVSRSADDTGSKKTKLNKKPLMGYVCM